jgi:hypothetical protein
VDPGIFDSKDLEGSYIEFTLALPEGESVDKIVIVGSYQDNLERVTIKEITTFPSIVRITSADAAQKLGIGLSDIENGDVFIFEMITTNGGITTRSSAAIVVAVACAYDVELATGSYHSVSTDWNSEGDITITADPDDPYTVYVKGLEEIDGLVEDKGPLVMHINPVNYAVTADKTILASDAWGLTDIAYEGTGTYNSCNGTYVMYFEISVVEGSWGQNMFTFTRN